MEIKFDQDRCICKGTDLCSCVCPYGFILQRDRNNHIGVAKEFEQYCINCGQCTCICPGDAITIIENTEKPEQYDRKINAPVQQVEQLLKTRRSVRVFKEKQVPRQVLEEVLNITRWIPTASNNQQLKWIVIHSPEKVRQISKLTIEWIKQTGMYTEIVAQWEKDQDIVLRKAPCLIIVLGENDYFWSNAEAGIALTYLELFAYAKKLGTCWAGFFTKAVNSFAPLADYLELPDGYKVCGGVMIGYPVFRFHSIPVRKELDIIWR